MLIISSAFLDITEWNITCFTNGSRTLVYASKSATSYQLDRTGTTYRDTHAVTKGDKLSCIYTADESKIRYSVLQQKLITANGVYPTFDQTPITTSYTNVLYVFKVGPSYFLPDEFVGNSMTVTPEPGQPSQTVTFADQYTTGSVLINHLADWKTGAKMVSNNGVEFAVRLDDPAFEETSVVVLKLEVTKYKSQTTNYFNATLYGGIVDAYCSDSGSSTFVNSDGNLTSLCLWGGAYYSPDSISNVNQWMQLYYDGSISKVAATTSSIRDFQENYMYTQLLITFADGAKIDNATCSLCQNTVKLNGSDAICVVNHGASYTNQFFDMDFEFQLTYGNDVKQTMSIRLTPKIIHTCRGQSCKLDQIVLTAPPISAQVGCFSQATKMLVYNNSNQTNQFGVDAEPENVNNAFFAGDNLFCMISRTLDGKRTGFIEKVPITKTNTFPTTLSAQTTMPTTIDTSKINVVLKIGSHFFKMPDIIELKLCTNKNDEDTCSVGNVWSDFTPQSNTLNYHLKSSWTQDSKAIINGIEHDVKWDLPTDVTESAIVVLRVSRSLAPNIQVREGWNDFVYNGTYFSRSDNPIQLTDANSKLSSNSFQNGPYYPDSSIAPYTFPSEFVTSNTGSVIDQSKSFSVLHLTLLGTEMKSVTVKCDNSNMEKLDDNNFIFVFMTSFSGFKEVTLDLKNPIKTETIKVMLQMKGTGCAGSATKCGFDQIVLAVEFPIPTTKQLSCISDATKLLVYNHSTQSSQFVFEATPEHKNDAFFKNEVLHCIATETTVPLRLGTIQDLTVATTNTLPTWPANPTMPQSISDVFVVVKIGAEMLAVKDVVGLSLCPDGTQCVTSANFDNFKLKTNSLNLHMKASWTVPKAKIGSDSYDVKLDLPDEVTESAVVVLRIIVPTSPSISVRAGWNDFVYNGTYFGPLTYQVTSSNSKKANLNFFRAPQFPSSPTGPYYADTLLQTDSNGVIQETGQSHNVLLVTLLGEQMYKVGVKVDGETMDKLDDYNFVFTKLSGFNSYKQVTLEIENDVKTETIQIQTHMPGSVSCVPGSLLLHKQQTNCIFDQIVLAVEFPPPTTKQLSCISDATKLLVYNHSTQSSQFVFEATPEHKNDAFFKNEVLHCIATETTVPLRLGTIQDLTVATTNTLPTWPANPTMPQSISDVFVVVKIGAEMLAVKDVVGLSLCPDGTQCVTSANFDNFKLKTNSLNLHMKASWTVPKAKIGSDSYDVKLDLPDEVTESAVVVLRIIVPTSPSISVRAGWNDFVYNGTYYNSINKQVSSDNSLKADKSFYNAPKFQSTPNFPFSLDQEFTTDNQGIITQAFTQNVFHLTLLGTKMSEVSVTCDGTAMKKLDDNNFLLSFAQGFTGFKQTKLVISNPAQTETISVQLLMTDSNLCGNTQSQLSKQGTPSSCRFDQVVLAREFPAKPDPPPTEENVLLVFKKKNTKVGKTADVCTTSTLTVTINNTLLFNETTTNCTIDVLIPKSKIIPGFDVEWEWTQAGEVISEGKQKITGRIVSEAQTTDGFEFTTSFMTQSYITDGEITAIIIGSIALLYLVCVVVCCFCTNCKHTQQQHNVYQM